MKISTSITNHGPVLLKLVGEVDAHTVGRLDQTLKDLVSQGHYRLVLDASQLEYIASKGLRSLLLTQREVSQLGGEVRLFGLTAPVRRIFELAGFDELLLICHTRQEAMEGW
ncbi:MAG: STAS domain-containing protein [Anaerolineales bacterium]|nr:MAG: STAS domain-containing protein [Anaerolineales bacterium]